MNNDRARISPMWLSGAIGVGIVLALAAAYPRSDMQAHQLAALPPSQLSVAYLEAWLRIEPDSPEYLNLLATQYLGLGNWDAVQRTAEKLATRGNDAIRRRALLMQVTAAERQAYAVKPDDAQRPERMVRYIGLLEQTAQHEWDVPIMRSLAEKARAAGATAVMLHYYRKLAATDTANATQWHEKLGDAAFARQAYADAASAYFAAQDEANTLDGKRRYFIAALKVLESGDQIGLACDEGERRAGSLAEDPQTLRYLLGLARQAARADLTARYGRALAKSATLERSSTHDEVFEANPDVKIVHAWPAPMYLDGHAGMQRLHRWGDARIQRVAASPPEKRSDALTVSDYERAFEAFLERHRLADAEEPAEQAPALHLDPWPWTRRLAQVAQRNNHPTLALKYWLSLARQLRPPLAQP